MEKFGIFNLLSALADLSSQKKDAQEYEEPQPAGPNETRDFPAANVSAKEDASAEETPRAFDSGIFTAEQRKMRMMNILERHDSISRRIDTKKNK